MKRRINPRSHTKRHERRTNIRVVFFVRFRVSSWIKFAPPLTSNSRRLKTALVKFVFAELVVDAARRDVEQPGGLCLIAAGAAEGQFQKESLAVFERTRETPAVEIEHAHELRVQVVRGGRLRRATFRFACEFGARLNVREFAP